MVRRFESGLLKYNNVIPVMFHLGNAPFKPGAISIDFAYSSREHGHIDGYYLIDIMGEGIFRHEDVGSYGGSPVEGILLTDNKKLIIIGVDLL